MNWIKTSEMYPDEEGIYLCDMDGHYGLFCFKDGKFQPNYWNEYVGYASESSYTALDDLCIFAWSYLPMFEEPTIKDIAFYKKRRKERLVHQKNLNRAQKTPKRS